MKAPKLEWDEDWSCNGLYLINSEHIRGESRYFFAIRSGMPNGGPPYYRRLLDGGTRAQAKQGAAEDFIKQPNQEKEHQVYLSLARIGGIHR